MPGRPQITARRKLDEVQRLSVGKMHKFLREADLTPMEVMYANMQFEHENAQAVAIEVGNILRGDERTTPDHLTKIMELWATARSRAQEYARDLAPYWHPRWNAVRVRVTEDPGQLTDDELIATLADTLTEEEFADLVGEEASSPEYTPRASARGARG